MAADKLFFFSKSADRAPGKGAGERVADPAAYAALAGLKEWRKVLSNFHVMQFEYRGKKYRTIEHAFQAAKIALVDPAAARRFEADSGDPIGLGDGAVAQKNRKLVKLNAEQIQAWDAMSAQVMREAAVAKYAASPEARAVLRATGHAELWHVVMRKPPMRFAHLEEIRALL